MRAQLPCATAFLVPVVDPVRLGAPMKYEAPGAGAAGAEKFPHVGGLVPVDAVVQVEPWL